MKQPSTTGIVITPADRKIVKALKKKLGVSFSAIVRMGIRCLAAKEGLSA